MGAVGFGQVEWNVVSVVEEQLVPAVAETGIQITGGIIFEDDASGDLNAGLGYRWNQLLFDYGYHIPLDLTETNGSHRFSLVWQL
mgnify:CR=1